MWIFYLDAKWHRVSRVLWYGHIAQHSGHWTHTFDSGVAVYVFGNHDQFGGILQITIDGQYQQSVDLYSATAICAQKVFSNTNLTNGQHTINLELTGESPNVTPSDGYTNGIFVLTNITCVFFRLPIAGLNATIYADIQFWTQVIHQVPSLNRRVHWIPVPSRRKRRLHLVLRQTCPRFKSFGPASRTALMTALLLLK